MSHSPLNLLAIGASGVGKSSFLNYLLDRNEFPTDRAVPTTRKGFWHQETQLRGFPIHLIDSWGLEAGESEEWIIYLHGELKRRGVESNITEWFHGVCYLIAATGNRVQSFDLEILSTLIREGYSVIVVLTKAAKVDEDTILGLRTEIARAFGDTIPIVAVNSIQETLRDGHITEVFGIEEVEQEIVRRFWETIKDRIPLRIGHLLEHEVIKFWDIGVMQHYLTTLDRRDYFQADKIAAELHNRAEAMKRVVEKEGKAIRDREITNAKVTFKALGECLDVGNSWEMDEQSQASEVRFECLVRNPPGWDKFWDICSFGVLVDASETQRTELWNKAEAFSKAIKQEIHSRVVPQIAYSIETIKIDASKLSKRRRKSWLKRLLGWLLARIDD